MIRSDRQLARSGGGLSVLVLAALLPALPARSLAAERDEVGARVLFGEGRKLVDEGRYPEACVKFEESLRLDPGVGTSFNLADCEERIGRTASAWARFLDVAAATRLAGQVERERAARARASALEPRLARLMVVVAAPEAGLTVMRDQRPLGAAAWGIPIPVDPGAHVVEATAPGKQRWSQSTLVSDTAATIVVSVPALDEQATSSTVPRAVPEETAVPMSRSGPGDKPHVAPVGRRWGPTIAVGALGAAGLVGGAVFALRFRSENTEAMGLCPANACQSADEKARHDALVDDAHRDRALAFATSAIGAASVFIAAYLWWRPGHPPSPQPAAIASRLVVYPGVGLGTGAGSGSAATGARLEGVW